MEKLKQKRIEKGLTLEQLGERVGLTPNTVYQYESDRRKPNMRVLKKLAEALECSVEDII